MLGTLSPLFFSSLQDVYFNKVGFTYFRLIYVYVAPFQVLTKPCLVSWVFIGYIHGIQSRMRGAKTTNFYMCNQAAVWKMLCVINGRMVSLPHLREKKIATPEILASFLF